MKRTLGLLVVLCAFVGLYAQQATAQKGIYKVAGTWAAVTKMPDKNINETWTIQQNGDKITGTIKSDSGEYPFAGTIDDVGFFRVDVKVGDMVYKVRATLDKDTKDTLDGSILIGPHEHVWGAKLAKK